MCGLPFTRSCSKTDAVEVSAHLRGGDSGPGHRLAVCFPVLQQSWRRTSKQSIVQEIEHRYSVTIVGAIPGCPCDIYLVGAAEALKLAEVELRGSLSSRTNFRLQEWLTPQTVPAYLVNDAVSCGYVVACDPGNYFNFRAETLQRIIRQFGQVLLVAGVPARSWAYEAGNVDASTWFRLPACGHPEHKRVMHFVSSEWLAMGKTFAW